MKTHTYRVTLYTVLLPLIVTLGICVLFYPGFMSFDTLHALRGARNGVTDSMWPPMVSYIWRAVDLISNNPSAMHFAQTFLLIVSVSSIIHILTKRIEYSAILLLIYLSVPVIIGSIAVIWKDILMAALFLAGFAIIIRMREISNRLYFNLLSLLAGVMILLGICTRHNAIAGAVPLLFYFAFVMFSRKARKKLSLIFGIVLLGSSLTGAMYLFKIQLDRYSLPNFEKLNDSSHEFIESVRVLDVAGASLCVGRSLFEDLAPNLSLDDIKSGYDPRHINLSVGLMKMVPVDNRINRIWLDVAIHHPICILYNKFQLTKYLIGANSGPQFIITAPSIDNNEYGYSLPKSSLRNMAVRYIIHASGLFIFRPWFIYILSMIAFAYLFRIKALSLVHLVLYLSGVFYFAGLVLFGNAADARLPFFTTTVFIIFVFLAVFELVKKLKSSQSILGV